jgi:hypothetical protein
MTAQAQKSPGSWLRTIPGFRSGTPWKKVAGVLGYVFIAAGLIGQTSVGSASGILLMLGVLGIVLLAGNAWGVRTSAPMLRSSNKVIAATAWAVILLVWLTAAALAAPPAAGRPSNPTSAVAMRPSPTLAPSPSLTTTPTPSDTAAPNPTASPATTATPTRLITQKPVVPAATPKPTIRATPPPPAPFNYCGAPVNPWHYNFCSGAVISSPPANICAYFNCIASFWKSTNGYVEECKDGMYSHSGGVSGSCSSHGGNWRPLLHP